MLPGAPDGSTPQFHPQTTARPTRRGRSALGWPSRASRTRAAATATPSPRPSSSPGSQKLKLRCVWREEFETLDEARAKIGAYIEAFHHRPHSGLAYSTPREVAATWKTDPKPLTPAA